MSEQSLLDIKVLVGSHQPDVIRELELLLAESFPIQLIGCVADGRTCIDRAIGTRPHIVLIDETIGVVPALDVARQIAMAAPGTAAIIISQRSDATLLHQALTAGARDVLTRPIMLDTLRASLLRAYELEQARTQQLLIQQADALITSRSTVVALYSARGGAGVSTLAVNLAVALAQALPQARTALVDLNPQFGVAATLLGLKPERTILDLAPFIDDLANSSAVIGNVLTPHSSGVRVLAAPPLHLAPLADADAVANILLALRRAFSFVIVDLPKPLDDASLAVLERADQVLYVMTPDVLAVQAARTAFDLLRQRALAQERLGLVINRVNKRLEIQPRDLRALFAYPVLAEIPADFYAIEEPMSLGQPLAEGAARSASYQAIQRLARALIERRPRPSPESITPTAASPLQPALVTR